MNRTSPKHLLRSVNRDLPEESLWSDFRDHADSSALCALIERLGPRLFARCRFITADRQLAEDAIQESLARLYAARHRLQTYPEAVAWLYRTATNAARHITRGRRRASYRERVVGANRPERVPDTTTTLFDAELGMVLARALIDLPENERRAIELVYFERMTHTEAAAALGWSRGSVGVYAARGLRQLREGLSRRGMAVTASAVVAALGTPPAGAGCDWPAVLERAATAADTPIPTSAVGGLMTTKSWWALGVVVVAVGVVSGVWCVQSGRKPDPTPATPAATQQVESLAAKNDRLFRRDVLPELLAELTRMLPPDNPPRVVAVRTNGTQIECEFVTTGAFLPTTKPTGIRVRYCTLRRRMDVLADLHGGGAWKAINPERPIIFDLAIPGLGLPAWDTGHRGIAIGRQAFDKLPIDDRAEAELARTLFGEPGKALNLPQEVRAVTAVGDRWFVTTQDSGLFARDGGRWRYRGECPGWFLSAVGDRLYADRDGVESRPVDGTGAAWERVCGRPPEDWKKFEVRGMAVAGDRVHYAVHRRTDGATALWSKTRTDPKAVWVRGELPVSPVLLTGAGVWLYSGDADGRLVRRPAADPNAKWEPIGRLPVDVGLLQTVGDRLLAFDRAKGSIHARSVVGVGVEWQEVGQIHRTE